MTFYVVQGGDIPTEGRLFHNQNFLNGCTHVYTCVIVDEGSDSHWTDMSISGEEGHRKTLKKEGRSEIFVKYIHPFSKRFSYREIYR